MRPAADSESAAAGRGETLPAETAVIIASLEGAASIAPSLAADAGGVTNGLADTLLALTGAVGNVAACPSEPPTGAEGGWGADAVGLRGGLPAPDASKDAGLGAGTGGGSSSHNELVDKLGVSSGSSSKGSMKCMCFPVGMQHMGSSTTQAAQQGPCLAGERLGQAEAEGQAAAAVEAGGLEEVPLC